MPTYEYQCEKCGLQFEEYQSITADPLTRCKNESCDGTIKRLFSAGAGFIFKGSGFYITDYRSDSYKKGAGSDGGSVSAASPTALPKPADTKAPSTPSTTAPAKTSGGTSA